MTSIDAIEAAGKDLGRRAAELTWAADPFWERRFGARGRTFTAEDGGHHVTWLCEAMRAGQPDILSRYAQWLRSVLTTRGMCTLHLVDHLRSTGVAITEAGLDPDHAAAPHLDAACAALRYVDGEAGRVDAVADELAGGDRRLREHLSYLADALDHRRPDLFVLHVHFARREPDLFGPVDEILRALADRVPVGAELVRGALR